MLIIRIILLKKISLRRLCLVKQIRLRLLLIFLIWWIDLILQGWSARRLLILRSSYALLRLIQLLLSQLFWSLHKATYRGLLSLEIAFAIRRILISSTSLISFFLNGVIIDISRTNFGLRIIDSWENAFTELFDFVFNALYVFHTIFDWNG